MNNEGNVTLFKYQFDTAMVTLMVEVMVKEMQWAGYRGKRSMIVQRVPLHWQMLSQIGCAQHGGVAINPDKLAILLFDISEQMY